MQLAAGKRFYICRKLRLVLFTLSDNEILAQKKPEGRNPRAFYF